jgi:hypothetical protein
MPYSILVHHAGVSLAVLNFGVANTALKANTKITVIASRTHHTWIVLLVAEITSGAAGLKLQQMITLTFYLFFTQTIITNIVGAIFVLTTPHALLFRIATKVTVVTLAVRFEFAVVETPDANGVVAYF